MNYLSPLFNEQTFDDNGDPLVGGQIYTYVAGTSTPLATYTTQNGVVQHDNPIILDARGEPPNPIWLGPGQEYKFQLYDALNNLIRTIDDVSGINDTSTDQSEWQVSTLVPTYISATSFSVLGDQTLVLSVGRRLRSENTGGTVYSTISTSTFGAGITTVVVRNDSGVLDSGLSAIAYGVLAPTNSSLPNSQEVRQTMGLGYGVDIASAATVNLSTRTGKIVRITGTVETTAVTMVDGDEVIAIAVAAWPIKIANVLTYLCAAGDVIHFTQDENGTQHAVVHPFNGKARNSETIFDVGTPTVAANALTCPAAKVTIDFRSTTAGSGAVTSVNGELDALVVPDTATLGSTNGVQSKYARLAINNAGTIEQAIINVSTTTLNEEGVISTTAIGTGSDSAAVAYSNSARASVAYRVIQYFYATQATAGTWATAPSIVQGVGGSARQFQELTIGTTANTTSGTSVDITGIPAAVKRVTLCFNGVSTNGTSIVLVQLGSGSVVATGYLGTSSSFGAAGLATTNYTAGFGIGSTGQTGAATVRHGSMVFNHMGGNIWTCAGNIGESNGTAGAFTAGSITLSGSLDRIRLTTVNGTDAFDAGSVNILYE